MKEKENNLKNFFNSVGFSAALMAGFSFSGILELRSWIPSNFNHIPYLKEATLFFMVASFVIFLMPVLLNMCFLNIRVDSPEKIKALRKVQLYYTLLIGAGVGCLEGALYLFMLGTFPFVLTCGVLVLIILSLITVLVIMRRLKNLQ